MNFSSPIPHVQLCEDYKHNFPKFWCLQVEPEQLNNQENVSVIMFICLYIFVSRSIHLFIRVLYLLAWGFFTLPKKQDNILLVGGLA